jgi:aminoglycoside phosphotransferase (APT) family kinase protein
MVAHQFPQWADLQLERLVPGGSDHVIYRLGDALTVRFPRHAGAVDQARLESRWLPLLARQLPLAIPEPVAIGEPAADYPWHWSVNRWLNGEPVTVEEFGDSTDAARVLAEFVIALRSFPTDNAPDPSPLPLAERDADTRRKISKVSGSFDAAQLTEVWDRGLAAPPWGGAPVWFHGDFHTGNLLADDHRITAVIDFGSLGLGDPANDLMMAFTLFSPAPRAIFRDALAADDASWQRGRAWALATGLTAYTAYAAANPAIRAATTRQILAAVEG